MKVLVSKEDFIEQLNEVKISSATKAINDVAKRQQDFLQGVFNDFGNCFGNPLNNFPTMWSKK